MWRSQPRNPQNRSIDFKRLRLREITRGTIEAINNGYVDFSDAASNHRPVRHSLIQSADDTIRGTEYFRPESTRLDRWQQGPPTSAATQSRVEVQIRKMSTLQGARFLSEECPGSRIGVLNFASATQPGGGFITGTGSAQQESIARSSSLLLSLQTNTARSFYALHDQDKKGGYYSHAMIYSPSVAIFRDDDGEWLRPYHVDVVSTPPVNAGLVRKSKSGRESEMEDKILTVMKERMGRILALFELKETRNLVLGSFGTGGCQNDVASLAEIWRELLVVPGARFAHSFDNVVFAIPDSSTGQKFRAGFDSDPAVNRRYSLFSLGSVMNI